MLGTLGCFDTPWVLLGIAFSKTQTSLYFTLKNVPRWHYQVRQTESEEEEEETESEEGRKRGSWGTIRQTCPGHVVRVRERGGDDSPPTKGIQSTWEHFGTEIIGRKKI